MRLHEELYFEITVKGARNSINKFVSFLTSGVLDDFFEFTSDYVIYGDDYYDNSKNDDITITLANDDYGIEIDSINPERFLDVLCSGGENLFIHGNLYDVDNDEYRFVSNEGTTSYDDADNIDYSDELEDDGDDEEEEEF